MMQTAQHSQIYQGLQLSCKSRKVALYRLRPHGPKYWRKRSRI